MDRVTSRRRVALRAAGLSAAGAAALGTLAACGQQDAGAPPRPGTLKADATLVALIDLGAADLGLFEPGMARWKSAHPQGPRIDWSSPGGAPVILEKTQALLAAGTGPDLIQQEATGSVSLSSRGQVLALDGYMKRDKYDASDFFERALPQFDWKAKRYGLSKGCPTSRSTSTRHCSTRRGCPTRPPRRTRRVGTSTPSSRQRTG